MSSRDYSLIPPETMAGLRRYVDHGVGAGHFLNYVLENNLFRVFEHADDANVEGLHALVTWIYNREPQGCWGSPEIVKRWKEHHGKEGL